MKKILALLLALLMAAFVFVGCDESTNTNENTNGSNVTPPNENNNQNSTNLPSDNTQTTVIPNTWDPTYENLVGLGIYLLDNNQIPFSDGQKLIPNQSETVIFDDFYSSYYTGITHNKKGNRPIVYEAVHDAAFTRRSFTSKKHDGVITSNVSLQFIVDRNKYSNYIVGYIYSADNEMYMIVDTQVYEVGDYENYENDAVQFERELSIEVDNETINFTQNVFCNVMYNCDYTNLNTYESFVFVYRDNADNIVKEFTYTLETIPSKIVWEYGKHCFVYGVNNGNREEIHSFTSPLIDVETTSFDILKGDIGYKITISVCRP